MRHVGPVNRRGGPADNFEVLAPELLDLSAQREARAIAAIADLFERLIRDASCLTSRPPQRSPLGPKEEP